MKTLDNEWYVVIKAYKLTVFDISRNFFVLSYIACPRYLYIRVYRLYDMCVRTYHMRNNYVTYTVAMRPNFSRLLQFKRLLCIAAMSSLPQLQLQDGYREAEVT